MTWRLLGWLKGKHTYCRAVLYQLEEDLNFADISTRCAGYPQGKSDGRLEHLVDTVARLQTIYIGIQTTNHPTYGTRWSNFKLNVMSGAFQTTTNRNQWSKKQHIVTLTAKVVNYFTQPFSAQWMNPSPTWLHFATTLYNISANCFTCLPQCVRLHEFCSLVFLFKCD